MTRPVEFNIVAQVSHIEANRGIKDALMVGMKAHGPRKRISVTDLTSLKQAYFRRKHPDITPTLEKQQVMWSGTGFHELFGAAVSSEEYLEQFVELDGVVGKIDIFEDMPVEVKTTRRIADESDLARKRPSYIEQLGMYCAMTDVKEGRIVIYQREGDSGQPPLSVCHVRFSDLDAIKNEMRQRRELLENALASDDPSHLPACPWGEWGCDYASVCDCKTKRVKTTYAIRDQLASLDVDDVAARQFLDKLAAGSCGRASGRVRLNDIVFPRKTYLSRVQRDIPLDEEEQEQEARDQLASMEKWGMIGRVRDCLLYSPESESRRVPVSLESLSDMVLLHQGRPAVARLMQLNFIVQRERLPQMSGHFFTRLGFECALTDQHTGRMVLYYPRVTGDDAKLMVYDVSFKDVAALKAEAARRISLLETAQGVAELPMCPQWMCRYCKDSHSCYGGDTQKPLW